MVTITAEESSATKKKLAVALAAAAQSSDKKKKDALVLAYALLLSSSTIQMQSAQTDAKAMQADQQQMINLNIEENANAFEQFCGSQGNKVQVLVTTPNERFFIRARSGKNPSGLPSYSMTPKAALAWLGAYPHQSEVLLVGTNHRKTMKVATGNDYLKIGAKNQGIEAQRNYIGNKLMVVQQNSQVTSSTMNTTTDYVSQQIQMMGNLCSLLTQLANLIGQMNRGS